MTTMNNEALQVLMLLLNKAIKREPKIVSLKDFEQMIENFDQKPNFREPSPKSKYGAALKKLECNGDIYRLSDADFATELTQKELKEKLQKYQKVQTPATSLIAARTLKMEDVDCISSPITGSVAYAKELDYDEDDDDDDLFEDEETKKESHTDESDATREAKVRAEAIKFQRWMKKQDGEQSGSDEDDDDEDDSLDDEEGEDFEEDEDWLQDSDEEDQEVQHIMDDVVLAADSREVAKQKVLQLIMEKDDKALAALQAYVAFDILSDTDFQKLRDKK